MNKLYLDKEWLGYQYLELKKSTYKIAREYGFNQSVIRNWIKKSDIRIRSYSEACAGRKGHKAWSKGLTKEIDERVRRIAEAKIGRHHSEQAKMKMKAKKKGENHWNWRGGVREPYPFDFNEELKELIRKRDDYICQLCHIPQRELLQKLSVHHIDYVKENLDPKNLISLCRGCNAKVNFERENWTEYFTQKTSR